MENAFDIKLIKWAEKAVNYCHGVATDPDSSKRIDKTFYAFQSKPVENPEILILGINPGEKKDEDCTYTSQKKNWKNIENGMTVATFVKGNPHWDEHEKWSLWRNLMKVFYTTEMQNIITSNKFVYMNALYFNSNNIAGFYKLSPNSKDVFQNCITLTKELIVDIIKPKVIVCLSIPQCFDRLKNKDVESELLLKTKIRLLARGEFCGIPTYGIPHTSGCRNMSNNDWELIGENIHKEIF